MKFLCVLCVLCGSSFSVFGLNREAFAFTKYDLDVRIEPDQQRLAVRGKITLRNDSGAPQKNLTLQISSSLNWRSIRLGEKPVQFVSQPFTSDIDHTGGLSEAIVSLPEEVAPGGKLELDIGYEGTIALDATRLTRIGAPEAEAHRSDWDQISSSFTTVRGIGYVAWYPVATDVANLSESNTVSDTVGRWKAREAQAQMNVDLHYLEQSAEPIPKILCTGKESDGAVLEMGKGREINSSCTFSPLGITVPSFVVSRYELTANRFADIFSLPEHKALAEAYAASVEVVAPYITEWFGSPQSKIVVGELPDPTALSFASGDLLLAPFKTSNSKQTELAAVQQLTHAAFLSPRLWVSEGLTHFAQALYREQQDGRLAALEFMKAREGIMLAVEKEHTPANQEKASAQNSLINTSSEELYRGKAMYVWWMLCDMIGEAALKKALAQYQASEDKEPSYVQKLVEAQSKKDLEWFFDDWVYRDKGLPDFRIVSVYPRQTLKGTYLVTVTVENLGNAGAEMPVKAYFAGGDSAARLEVRGKSRASIRLETTSPPEQVIVNDGSVPESDVSNNTFKVETNGAGNR